MDFGICLFTSDRGITPARAAQAAEEHGFRSFYVPEHTHIPVSRETIHPGTGTAELPDDRYMRTLDPWVALATAASVTSTIRLATAVALPVEHDAITLAKTIASLDHLSGGRVVVGAGFGWNAEEMADHGVPSDRRRDVLREYLEAMEELWSKETASYEGEFVKFGPSWAWPKPLQQPRPPILIGAAGTEKSFAWIAKSADGWITTPRQPDALAVLPRLHDAWAAAGREGRPHVVVLAAKPTPELLGEWRDAGVDEVMLGLPDRSEDDILGYLGRRANLVGEYA